ncbi:MAG: phosphoenolpyruvate--protein phosphotransferase [Planctomycetota bacterium]|jgi:phosphotransferase system enzyme I (PtsI)
MQTFSGIGASEGIAIGPASLLTARVVVRAATIPREQVDEELTRLHDAFDSADQQLTRVEAQLLREERSEAVDIIAAHRLMLGSDQMRKEMRALVHERCCSAEWAVRQVITRLEAAFERLEDPYFRDRRSDIEAMGERLLRTLTGLPERQIDAGGFEGAIAVGENLSPVDAMRLHAAGLAGVVTERGGATSHAAILVRALGLAYVVGVEEFVARVAPGDTVALDGTRGEVVIDPDETTLKRFEARKRHETIRAAHLQTVRDLPAETRDGVRIQLSANVERLQEVSAAVELGIESVGLFRTEFLYLGKSDLPSEEEQYEDAAAAVKVAAGRPITFRTLDLADDKVPFGVPALEGANPALGLRGVRFSLRHADVFRTQLRALYRASTLGPVRIMFPMVSGVTEFRAAKSVCGAVVEELAAAGVAHDPHVLLGAMVETPSAAMTADYLARECDFLSIGTNDLVQYACAAARDNKDVGHVYCPLHPAILRAIKQTVDAASAAGKPASLCGDMAGDPLLTWVLLGLGLRDFSMIPRHILVVKSVIRATRLHDAERLAEQALRLPTEVEIENLVVSTMGPRFVLELSHQPRG